MAANEFAAKLGMRSGQRVYLEGAPAEFAAERLTGLSHFLVRRELR